jgi:hypothetical protein
MPQYIDGRLEIHLSSSEGETDADLEQIDEELVALGLKPERNAEAMRYTGGVPVGPMQSEERCIMETLHKPPSRTLHRNNGKLSFTPRPPKPLVERTQSQRVRSFQLRARLALAEG